MTAHAQWLTTAPQEKVSLQPKSEPFALKALKSAIQLYGRFSSERAGKFINKLWFTPRRTGMGARYEHLLDRSDSFTQLRFGAYDLPVYSWGDGPVILCVHGWSGSGIQFGSMVEPLLRQGYRVVVFDAPAHGRAQGERTNILEMKAVIEQVAHLFGEIHAIIAHSLGSVASILAVADGLRVGRLALIAPPTDLDSVVQVFGRQLDIPERVLNVHRRLLEEEFGPDVWKRLDLLEYTPQLQAAGLVISDLNDEEVPFEHGELIARDWHGARFLKTASLGHYKILRDEEVMTEISGFLSQPTGLPLAS